MKTCRSLLLLLTFAVWWGGLTFYSAAVVPIGTEQIGKTEQGFITQQVTWWHNLLTAALTGVLLVEAWLRRHRGLGLLGGGLAMVSAALFFQHARLTGEMDFSRRAVPSTFYSQHALYLWLTTAEWFLGLALAFLLARDASRSDSEL